MERSTVRKDFVYSQWPTYNGLESEKELVVLVEVLLLCIEESELPASASATRLQCSISGTGTQLLGTYCLLIFDGIKMRMPTRQNPLLPESP
jgi:hypothetical protein